MEQGQDNTPQRRTAKREQEEGGDAGRAEVAALPPALEDRAAVRLAPELPPHCDALRRSWRELSRLRSPGLHYDFAQVLFMRPLLVTQLDELIGCRVISLLTEFPGGF